MLAFFTDWWQYGFMRNAFWAVLIITPLFGILGTMIVNRKMAFFSAILTYQKKMKERYGAYQYEISDKRRMLFFY